MSLDLLFLNNEEMHALGAGDMRTVLHDVERAYQLYAADDVLLPGKIVMRFGKNPEDEYTNGRINGMPGYVGGEYNMAGIKWVGSAPMNHKKGLPRASSTIILNDPETKLPVAVVDGTEVSAMRTGAQGGMAIKFLAKKNATSMIICGAGVQGRTQVEAALTVRPSITTVYVYDLYFDRAEAFAKEMEPKMREKFPEVTFIPVPAEELGNAVSKSDIVDTATLAQEPFIKGEWVTRGTLLINMSGYEMETDCVAKADKVVVDFWEVVKHRLHATVAHLADEGRFKDEDLYAEIAELASGKKTGRENEDEIIYFNAVGTGLLDLAVAAGCYKKALEKGIGITVPYWK